MLIVKSTIMKELNTVTTAKTLAKGESLTFLGYTIFNCLNNDGLVLSRNGKGAKGYECHLGNFGDGTDESNVNFAKMYAVLHFMIARPEHFAATICYRMQGRGGQYHEWFLFRDVVQTERLDMPIELTCYEGDMNCQIAFNSKHLFKHKKSESL